MEKDWVRIFTAANYDKSEMIKQALAGHYIQAGWGNKQDSSYPAFGAVEVYVRQKDFSNAIEIIILNQINL